MNFIILKEELLDFNPIKIGMLENFAAYVVEISEDNMLYIVSIPLAYKLKLHTKKIDSIGLAILHAADLGLKSGVIK